MSAPPIQKFALLCPLESTTQDSRYPKFRGPQVRATLASDPRRRTAPRQPSGALAIPVASLGAGAGLNALPLPTSRASGERAGGEGY